MNRFRFLKAAFTGIVIYTLLNVSVGRDGIWAMSQLQKQKREISAHTANIQKINDGLNQEKLALEKDRDLIAAYARKLGYVSEGEKIVLISGLAAKETQIFDPGTILKHTQVNYIPESICKSTAIVITVLAYFLLFMFDLSRGYLHFGKKRKSSAAAGISI